MKICWLLVLVPFLMWSPDPDDSPAIITDEHDPLYVTLVTSITTLSKEVDASITEFEQTVTMQKNRIHKLNILLEEADTRTRRLTIATCISSLIAAALIAREVMSKRA